VRSDIFKKNTPPLKRSVFISTYIYAILVCLSTLFVKQHYIFDGFVSVVLCEALYLIFKHNANVPELLSKFTHRINCQLGIAKDEAIPSKQQHKVLM
jgi:membrane-associated phospholipid phosphatase